MPHVSRTVELRLVIGAALTAILNLAGVAQAGDLYLPNGAGPYAPPPVVYGQPGYPPPPVVYGEPGYPPPPVVYGEPGYPPPPVVYGGPRYAPPPVIDRRVVDNGACRIVQRRHVDPYGREVVRRVRVCDEGYVDARPRWAERAPPYGYDPYYGAPRPPRAVPGPYDDLD